MLAWMHDPDAVAHLQGNFLEKSLQDCLRFIEHSQEADDDLHLAIAGEDDLYMGTVSLKHIDRQRQDAEFAIAMHPDAMGKGYAQFAMAQMLAKGLEEMGLSRIFWCVAPENKRAVRFYDKNGYSQVEAEEVEASRYYISRRIEQLLWYCVKKK